MQTNKIITIFAAGLLLAGCRGDKDSWYEIDSSIPITGIYVNVESLTLEKKATTTINYYPLPATADITQLVWETSDPAVATVDRWGRVKAVQVGEATLTVSTGSISKSIPITVTGNPLPVVPVPTAHARWTFNDPADLTKCEGSSLAKMVLWGDVKAIAGPNGDGAVHVATGPGHYLEVIHGINTNFDKLVEGEPLVEEWSLEIIFKYYDLGQYKCLLQTGNANGITGSNTGDGDLFINKSELFGRGSYFSPPLEAGKWYHLVFTHAADGIMKSWIFQPAMIQYTNDWVRGGTDYILPYHFAICEDEDGEDYQMDFAEVAIYNRVVTPEEVYAIWYAENDD